MYNFVFYLENPSRKLKDLVAFLGNHPEEIKNTLMVYRNGYLEITYEKFISSLALENVKSTDSSNVRTEDIFENQTIKVKLKYKSKDMPFEQIRAFTSLFNYIPYSKLNCQTELTLKERNLSIDIIPLDEHCRQFLWSIYRNIFFPLTYNFTFRLKYSSQKLKNLIAFLSSHPEEIKNTLMVYQDGHLEISYEKPISTLALENVKSTENSNIGTGDIFENQKIKLKLEYRPKNTPLKQILVFTSLFNYTPYMSANCQTKLSLKGNMLLTSIIALDEPCRQFLSSIYDNIFFSIKP